MFLQNIKEITCNLFIWCKRNSRGSQIRNFYFAFNLLCQFLQISSVIYIPSASRKSYISYWSIGTVKKKTSYSFSEYYIKGCQCHCKNNRCSTLEIDFFANFHPILVFFGGGFLNAPKSGKRKKESIKGDVKLNKTWRWSKIMSSLTKIRIPCQKETHKIIVSSPKPRGECIIPQC